MLTHDESWREWLCTKRHASRAVSRSGRALQKDGGRSRAAQREVALLCGCAALLCMVPLDQEKIKMMQLDEATEG
jgi:hypothetical protein